MLPMSGNISQIGAFNRFIKILANKAAISEASRAGQKP